ncbi:MAG: NmrA/HSCARG family protein [Gemmatimonadota bacterium]
MADKKTIAIIGATGAQGGGLARAILADQDGPFKARVLTRSPGSDKAKALAALGAEVVAANVDDEASLRRAFTGAHGAFCVTFFWDHLSAEKEQAEARSMAAAAKAAALDHVIWSTLEDTRKRVPISDDRMPTLQGKYKVPHFDGKGEADQFFTALPITYLMTAFYWENFIHFGMGPKRGADGRLALGLPMGDKKLPGIAAEDIGRCAYGVFKRDDLIGKRIGIAGEFLTGTEMAAGFSRALGEPVHYQELTPDAYRALGFPGADDLGNMFQYKRDFEAEYCGARSLSLSRALNPALLTFDGWLAEHKAELAKG